MRDMNTPDDKHGDHDLKAYLDGRDGVSAAYRQTAHDEPPAALDRLILAAARGDAKPAGPAWYAARKHQALAASVMLAVAALSLYVGGLDDVALQPESAAMPSADAGARVIRLERSTADQPPLAAEGLAEDDLATQDAAAETTANADAFRTRALAPAVPAIGAGAVTPVPAPASDNAGEAFARTLDAPVIVIDGPLLQQIEAEAEAAQASRVATAQLEEIAVTGSRIVRRGDTAYRDSREDWLVVLRGKVRELERSAQLTTAQRRTTELENELEREIELFLEQYPDTDLDAELWFAE